MEIVIRDKSSKVLDVKNYGAKGDGSTDDTTAIKAAIAAMTNESTLLFSAGTYKVTDLLTISTLNNISVIGENATIKNEINNIAKTVLVFTTCENVKISQIDINMNLKESPGAISIFGIKKGLHIEKCNVFNFKNHGQYGISLEEIGATALNYLTPTFTIKNCNFYNENSGNYVAYDYNNNNTRGTGIIFQDWAEYGRVSNCSFFNISCGILNDGGANNTIDGNSFYLCGVKSANYIYGSAIYFKNSAGNYGKNIVTNNHFNHNYSYSIYWNANAQPITIANNHFIANLFTPIGIVGGLHAIITGNYFETCNNFGGATNYPGNATGDCYYIVMNNTTRSTISNNTIRDNAGSAGGIATYGSSTKNTIIGNTYMSVPVWVSLVGTNNEANNYNIV